MEIGELNLDLLRQASPLPVFRGTLKPDEWPWRKPSSASADA